MTGSDKTRQSAPLDIGAAFREHGGFVARVIRRLTGEGPHVDDLVQETFVVAFRRRHAFEGRSTLRTWLYAIARKLAWRHHRGLRRFAAFVQGYAAEPEPAAPAPHVTIERREAIARVHHALARLPFKQREVVVLYDLEGLEGKEIADMIGTPVGTVWSRLTQGRATVEKLMRREQAREGA